MKIFFNRFILLMAILSVCLLLRISFLGYNTLGHGEAEMAENISYVMPCLSGYSYLKALWHLWHIFMMEHNPVFTTIFPLNFTFARFFGVNEFVIRINAVMGGMISAIMVFLLVRRRSDTTTALFALALFALNPYLIIYQRFGHHDSIQIAAALVGISFVDSYCRKRRPILLILSSICFSISFLLKMQAAVFISILLFLYFLYFGLKMRDLFMIAGMATIFTILLFIDQTGALFGDILKSSKGLVLRNGAYLSQLPQLLTGTLYFYASAHIKYFEVTILPLLISLAFWKKIDNRLFRAAVIFSALYFIIIVFQGRQFFRYLQMGVIASSIALAFPLKKYAARRYHHAGIISMIILLSISLFMHRSYVSAVYHHIPYKYIAKRANELRGAGRVLIYGRNSETEHYLSPTGNFLHDESVDPCQERIIKIFDDYHVMFDSVRKIPPERSALFDTSLVRPGDLLVVTGCQMVGGEPAPRLHGYDGRARRVYCHDLNMPKGFYNSFMTDKKMREKFIILERIYLTNNSGDLAALLLKRSDQSTIR